MSRSTLALPAALIAALLCAPLAAIAAPPATSAAVPAQRAGQPQRERPMSLFDQLKLTDAQRASVREILRQNVEAARPEMQALRQRQIAFDTALPGSANYATLARDLGEAEANAARAQVARQAGARTKIYNLLTATQRTQLADIQAKRAAQMQQAEQERARRAAAPAASR